MIERTQAAIAILGVTWRWLVVAALIAAALPAFDSLILAEHTAVPTLHAAAPAVGDSQAHRMYERFSSLSLTSWQVSASLLGLYFAAFSVIVSTSYSSINREVRRLIIRERLSDTYLAIVVLFVIVSGAYSLITVIESDLTLFSVGFLGLLGLFSFVAFPILGLRLFHLLEPKELAPYPLRSLASAIRNVLRTTGKPDASRAEQLSRLEAERSLVLFKELVNLASRREVISPADLSQDVRALFGALLRYGQMKGQIQRDSAWFRQVPSHSRWITLDEPHLSVALRTVTPVQPSSNPDYLWLEREILGCLTAAFAAGEKVEGWGTEIQSVVTAATGWVRTIAATGLTEESLLVSDALVRLANDHAGRPYREADDQAETAVALAASSLRGYAAAGVILGLFDFAHTISLDRIAARAADIGRGLSKNSDGASAEPHHVKIRIEKLLAERSLEARIEGRPVTKEWYYEAQLADAYRRWLRQAAEAWRSVVDSLVTTVEDATQKKELLQAAGMIPQALQAVARLQQNLKTAEVLDQRLGQLAGRALPESSNALDWKLLASEVNAAWAKLNDLWPHCLPFLFDFDDRPEFPDLPGQAFAFLSEETLRRLALGEPMEAVAPPLRACLGLGLDQRRRASERPQLEAVVDASLDILAMTGYAVLFGALHSTDIGEVVRQRWTALLADPRTATDRVKSFVAAYELRHDTAFSGRSLTRIRWQREAAECFGERGLNEWDPAVAAITGKPLLPWHSSPIVMAASAGGTIMFADGETVALATVLGPIATQLGIALPQEAQDLVERIERWELRMASRPAAGDASKDTEQ